MATRFGPHSRFAAPSVRHQELSTLLVKVHSKLENTLADIATIKAGKRVPGQSLAALESARQYQVATIAHLEAELRTQAKDSALRVRPVPM